MQLSPSMLIPPEIQPAAAQLPAGAGASTAPAAGKEGAMFAQIFPGLSPTASPKVLPTGKAPASKATESATGSTTLGSEATAALFSGWLASVMPDPRSPAVVGDALAPASAEAAKVHPGLIGMVQKDSAGILPREGEASSPLGSTPFAAKASFSSDARSAIQTTPSMIGPVGPTRPESPASPTAALAPTEGKTVSVPSSASAAGSLPLTGADEASAALAAQSDVATATADAVPAVKLGGRLKGPSTGRGEKIAQADAISGTPAFSTPRVMDKKILSAPDKQVTEPDSMLGTAVAKADSAMSIATSSERLPSAALAPVTPSTGATGLEASQRAPLPATSDSASVAHQAVEAAMSAADRLVTGEQKAVNLQFSVGNADLSVRVELRDGAVHATFRTDSPELRTALVHEWQSVNPGAADRPLRLADPVFTSANTPNFASSGENASQHRNGQERSGSSHQALGDSASTATGSELPVDSAPAALDSAPLSSSLHFHAFA